jgi:hypothetical protein
MPMLMRSDPDRFTRQAFDARVRPFRTVAGSGERRA